MMRVFHRSLGGFLTIVRNDIAHLGFVLSIGLTQNQNFGSLWEAFGGGGVRYGWEEGTDFFDVGGSQTSEVWGRVFGGGGVWKRGV